MLKERSKEAKAMGLMASEATIESLYDLWAVERGLLSADQVRGATIPDALVDTDTTLLLLPTGLIRQLDLAQRSGKRAINNAGVSQATMHDPVRLTIVGRSCTMDVLEVPDGTPVRIGQSALVQLDLVIDLRNRTLMGNPAHGGEQTLELLLHGIDDHNLHPEHDWGPTVGAELW